MTDADRVDVLRICESIVTDDDGLPFVSGLKSSSGVRVMMTLPPFPFTAPPISKAVYSNSPTREIGTSLQIRYPSGVFSRLGLTLSTA